MYIYKEKEIRKADKQAAERGLSEMTLMETAGRSIFYALHNNRIDITKRILVLAGPGNNGGDAVVLARYLMQHQYDVDLVFPFGSPRTDASRGHFQYFRSLGFSYNILISDEARYDVIVDGLLGVGLKLPLRENLTELIHWCNNQKVIRIAIDLPSGVMADEGSVEIAFQADFTYSLHGYKWSSFLFPSSQYFGEVEVLDIGLPHQSKWHIWTESDVKRTLSRRESNSHKGTFGNGLLLAGSDHMPGSCLLAGLAAMRMGIGKLTIGTSRFAASSMIDRLPEATYWFDALDKCTGETLQGYRGIAIGPGLEDPALVNKALETIFSLDIPIILDAGALHQRSYPKRKAPVVITPHPGEFSRLTGFSTVEIQQNRIQLASNYATEHQVVVVLKGQYTVIAYPDGRGVINMTGNPGLAKGGSGDTLTGMILALLCSEKDIYSAVANAVYLHGLCADVLIGGQDEKAILASDISEVIGGVLYKVLK